MKKLIALLMAMLMLAMPSLSLADSDDLVQMAMNAGRRAETTITLDLSSLPLDASVQGLVNDVASALKLIAFGQEGEYGLAVNLSGRDIFRIAGAVENDALYLESNMLGKAPIAVKEADIVPLINRFIDLLVLMDAISQADAAQLKEMIEQGIGMAQSELSSMNMEFDWTETDVTAFLTALENMLASTTVEPVTMQPRNCDPASEKARLTVTGEDMRNLWSGLSTIVTSTPDLVNMMEQALATTGMTLDELLDEMTAMLNELTAMIPDGLILDLYVNEAGELVCMTALLEFAETSVSTSSSANNVVFGKIGQAAAVSAPQNTELVKGEVFAAMGAQYNRLTVNEGIAHTLTMEVDADDELASITLDVLQSDSGAVCNLGMAMNGETLMSIALSADVSETETAAQETVSVEMTVNAGYEDYTFGVIYDAKGERNGVDVQQNKTIQLLFNGMKMVSVHADTETMQASAGIDTDAALRLATISNEEFQAWFVEVVNGLQLWMVNVLQALPASVLKLVLGM